MSAIHITLLTMRWRKLVIAAIVLVLLLSCLWQSTEFRAALYAVKGFSFCSVHMNNVVSRHECGAFDPPLPNTSQIIITFVNADWILLAQNWVCSARSVGLHDSLYIIALAPDVCSHFPTTRCFQHPSLSLPGALYAQPGYQKFMIERTKLILSILPCTTSRILLSDSDVVFLRDPIPLLNNELLTHDIVFQEDSTGLHMLDNFATYVYSAICGGFMFLKPNNRTMDLFLSVLAYQLNWNWNDQSGINICVRWHGSYIRWRTLDKELFPNGKEFFEFHRSNKAAMVVHANFIRYTPNKVTNMIEQGVWCLKNGI